MTDLKICSSEITWEEIQEFCAMIETQGLALVFFDNFIGG